MVYNLKGFGDALRDIRKSLNMSQKAVKDLVNVNQDTLRKLEGGESFPKIETLDLLSLAYKRDLNDLFSKYKITYDDYLEDRLHVLKPKFQSMDFKTIQEETEAFKAYFSESRLDRNLFIQDKIHQFTTYMTAVGNYEKAQKDKSREDLTAMRSTLEYSDAEIRSSKPLNLDLLEIRIFILMSIMYRLRDEFDTAEVYLVAAKSVILTKYKNHKRFIELYMLIIYNQMTTYHRQDRHQDIISLYKESLDIQNEKLNLNAYVAYFIRVGITKYYAGESDYNVFVHFALSTLRDLGFGERADRYVEIFKDKYPFLDLE